jgi:hypothetical protein
MTRSALAFIAAIILMVGFAIVPVSANETRTGTQFTLSLQALPDTASPGGTMSGTLSLFIVGDRGSGRRVVPYTVSVETPFGNSIVRSGSVSAPVGKLRTVRFSLPISDNATLGTYTLTVTATVNGETLYVHHTVVIS